MHRWSRLSLEAKLPLTLALLLLVVCGTMAAITYQYVRTSATTVADGRLLHAATQLGELLRQSTRQRLRQLRATVDRGRVTEYLQAPSDELKTVAAAALDTHIGKDVQTTALELWDAQLATVIRSGFAFEPVPTEGRRAFLTQGRSSPTGIVAPFSRVGDQVTYVLLAPLTHENVVIGYLVERRVLNQSAQTATVIGGLIGPDTTLLLGNPEDDVWTNMARMVPPPAVAARKPGHWAYARPDGQGIIAHAVNIPETPWLLAAEFPSATVIQPATRFLRTALTALLLLTAVGAGFGWALCRRVSVPVRQLTAAAELMAAGQAAPVVTTGRRDEVGRLVHSFNSMSTQITEGRARLEELVADLDRRVRERTAALEEANRELEAFSYSVSHDLRAPIRAIDGFTRILAEDHAAALPPDARQCLDVIVHRTKHMGLLIDDLLMFSRLGRERVTGSPVDMTAIATSSLEEARRVSAGRPVDVVMTPLPAADGERGLIRQIFENLVQNAFKFTRHRADARIEIGHQEQDNVPVYFVRDNGVGFDMQYADKLFGVFQRLHRAEDFEGTGVGLAIVERIVRRHGGRIWAESAVDRGATFYFTLTPGNTTT